MMTGNIFHITGLLCGEFTGEFPAQRPVMWSFDVFYEHVAHFVYKPLLCCFSGTQQRLYTSYTNWHVVLLSTHLLLTARTKYLGLE